MTVVVVVELTIVFVAALILLITVVPAIRVSPRTRRRRP
jgi:hypothetical protein